MRRRFRQVLRIFQKDRPSATNPHRFDRLSLPTSFPLCPRLWFDIQPASGSGLPPLLFWGGSGPRCRSPRPDAARARRVGHRTAAGHRRHAPGAVRAPGQPDLLHGVRRSGRPRRGLAKDGGLQDAQHHAAGGHARGGRRAAPGKAPEWFAQSQAHRGRSGHPDQDHARKGWVLAVNASKNTETPGPSW